ncbi:MAG: hypothetical protein WDM86_19845 [Rhizomicrobium sp.]
MAKRTLKSATVTARIAPKLEKKLETYARFHEQSKSKAVEGILKEYLDYDGWAVQGIREAIASSDRGESVSHDEALRQIRAHIAKRKRERRRAA